MISAFSHVGVVVRDLDAAIAHWTAAFGLEVVRRSTVEVENVRNAYLSTPGGDYGRSFCVELMEPIDADAPDSAIARRLREHGEGVFHLAMLAPDSEAEGRHLRDAGATVIAAEPVAPHRGPRQIVHPRSANGVLVEVLGPPSEA